MCIEYMCRTICLALSTSICVLILLPPPACGAHPVSMTETTIYVQREKVTATIAVFVEDLYLFQRLKPNQNNRLEPADIEKAKEEHGQFLLQRFVVRNAAGEALRGRVVRIDGFEM